jgi:hypothetical protein
MSDDTAARPLAEMWIERLPTPRDPRATLRAPLGRECASPAFLERTEGHEPERCAGCWWSVYYGYSTGTVRRRRALCSTRCVNRVARAHLQGGRESGT